MEPAPELKRYWQGAGWRSPPAGSVSQMGVREEQQMCPCPGKEGTEGKSFSFFIMKLMSYEDILAVCLPRENFFN